MTREPASLPLLVAGDPWLYTVARFVLVPLARLYGRLEVRGLDHVPRFGPALIVADHPSDLDPLVLALPIARTVHFLASADHYERPFVGWCMRRLATVSVDRHGSVPEALGQAVALLRAGHLVAVFPEPDEPRRGVGGEAAASHASPPPPGPLPRPLGPAGLAYLAQTGGAPLIPASIEGTAELQWGRWRRELRGSWPRRPRLRLTFFP